MGSRGRLEMMANTRTQPTRSKGAADVEVKPGSDLEQAKPSDRHALRVRYAEHQHIGSLDIGQVPTAGQTLVRSDSHLHPVPLCGLLRLRPVSGFS